MQLENFKNESLATLAWRLALILFCALMISSYYDIVKIENVFFPALGVVILAAFFRSIAKDRQRSFDFYKSEKQYEAERVYNRPMSAAETRGCVAVEADLERLRRATDPDHEPMAGPGRAGVEPSRPWGNDRRPSSRSPEQYSRRTDVKPATSASPEPAPAVHTYGSTYGHTNPDSYSPSCSSSSSSDSSSSSSCSGTSSE